MKIILLTACLIGVLASQVIAQPLYVPDNSFGTAGQVTLDFSSGQEGSSTMLLQPDGKAVVCGYSRLGSSRQFLAFARYSTTGVLDPTFGTAGKITFSVGTSAQGPTMLLPDGSFMAYGDALSNGARRFYMMKLLANGLRDTTFGTGGTFLYFAPENFQYETYALKRQPDGKFIGVTTANDTMVVLRVDGNGALDPTFGSGGRVKVNFGTPGSAGADAHILPNGNILVAGSIRPVAASVSQDILLTRLLPNGTVDQTFGTNGRTVQAYEAVQSEEPYEMYVQDDGKILLSGQTQEFGQSREPMMVRFLANGMVDAGFGTAGRMKLDQRIGSMTVKSVDPNGNIQAYVRLFNSGNVITVYGFTPSGQQDMSFGNNGIQGFSLGTSFTTWSSIYTNPDRSMFVAGHKQNTATGNDIVVKKFILNPAAVKPGLMGTLSLYPNPSHGAVRVSWEKALDRTATASLLDACGRIVRSLNVEPGRKELQLDLAGVPPGLYTLACPGIGTRQLAVE